MVGVWERLKEEGRETGNKGGERKRESEGGRDENVYRTKGVRGWGGGGRGGRGEGGGGTEKQRGERKRESEGGRDGNVYRTKA
jgi:polyribonucleotide nucleotidyltransferase